MTDPKLHVVGEASTASDTKDFSSLWIDPGLGPGAGLANGGRDGDPSTPLCLVAVEMRSGRIVKQWQGGFTPFPPYCLDTRSLFISYLLSAEFGFHQALGWGQPAAALDAYVEYRHYVNDGAIKSGDREKGFYSLAGALRYFCEDEIDTAYKKDMRDRIIQGPPFTEAEREEILHYCEQDVHSLARLVKRIVPTIRSLPHALFRGQVMWATACQERRGIPLAGDKYQRVKSRWDDIKIDICNEADQPFGCYEIEDGKPHWRQENFAKLIRRRGMVWPQYPDGSYIVDTETFRDMAGRYPFMEPLRELRYTMGKLKLSDLAVGTDNRNRCLLSPYGTKTARHAPSNSKYIFGPAKWLRHFIAPTPGRALIHRDFSQQEVRIAAVQSGDAELLRACESGDVYLGIAEQLGFIREGMAPAELEAVRAMFKTVVLGIQYGLGPRSLALRTGISIVEAAEILARLRARFRAFEAFARRALDRAGLDLEIGTPFSWYMQCPSGINSRTVRNFPIQSTGSEILHVLVVLAERRGLPIVAPVHDAVMVEADVVDADDVSAALDRAMRDASAVLLRGYELPTDAQIVRPGNHFIDKRGAPMWDTVTRLVGKLERERA
jgi:hypothetical protein